MTPFWKHKKLIPLVVGKHITASISEQKSVEGETKTNNLDCGQSNGEESEGDIIDTEVPDVVGGLTYGERIEVRIALLQDFADSLEYQLQFGDSRMLDCLE